MPDGAHVGLQRHRVCGIMHTGQHNLPVHLGIRMSSLTYGLGIHVAFSLLDPFGKSLGSIRGKLLNASVLNFLPVTTLLAEVCASLFDGKAWHQALLLIVSMLA